MIDLNFLILFRKDRLTLMLKKWSHFDLKSRVTGGTKIRPGSPVILLENI